MARILVIDDCSRTRDEVHHSLGGHGHEVLSTHCAGEGVQLAFSRRPELILMDTELIHLSGFETARLMRRHGYGGKLAALCAQPHGRHRGLALELGFDGVLHKPLGRQLPEQVRQLLS